VCAGNVPQTSGQNIGIPGVLVYIDDILIWGAMQEEHDERLKAFLKRLQEQEFSVIPKNAIICKRE
jgi:hypothetical protein